MDFTTIDWSWLASINMLQVAIVIIAFAIVIRLLVKFWPWLRKVMELTAALSQLPDFIHRVNEALERLRKQVENSHSTNLRDDVTDVQNAVDRIERGVKGLYDRADAADLADAALRKELEDTRPHKALPAKPQGETK